MKYLVIVLLLYPSIIWAHDPDRADLTPWFQSLKNGRGGYCCDGKDAVKLKDLDWDTKDGHYRARVDGKWLDIPDDLVVKQPNQDGSTLLWLFHGNVQCFMPGAET